jgi:hypothetical protein
MEGCVGETLSDYAQARGIDTYLCDVSSVSFFSKPVSSTVKLIADTRGRSDWAGSFRRPIAARLHFVEINNDEEAARVIQALNCEDFMGRNVVVNEARPREGGGGGRGREGGGRGGDRGGGGGRGRY